MKEMTYEQKIIRKLSDNENDMSIKKEERDICSHIYKAELSRIRSDERIEFLRTKINLLRKKIIDEIINIYDELGDDKKEIAFYILDCVGKSPTSTPMSFDVNDYIGTQDVTDSSGKVSAKIDEYVDENVHKDLVNLQELYREYLRVIDRKYFKLSEELSGIIDEEVFDCNSKNDSDTLKTKQQFADLYAKENKRIDEEFRRLDIALGAKSTLKGIFLDAIKYGMSTKTLYEKLEDMSGYVEQKQKEQKQKKTL